MTSTKLMVHADLRSPVHAISFRPLQDDDLPLLHRWLNHPAVVRWWEGVDVSWPGVVRRYGSGGIPGVEHWLASNDDDVLGWAQCYCAADVAEEEAYYWHSHLDLHKTAGIDYLVGAPTLRNRGIGSAMIHAFVRDVVFARHPQWAFAAAAPFEANKASWRALEKAGFDRLAVLDDEEGPCILMVASRDSVQAIVDGLDGRKALLEPV